MVGPIRDYAPQTTPRMNDAPARPPRPTAPTESLIRATPSNATAALAAAREGVAGALTSLDATLAFARPAAAVLAEALNASSVERTSALARFEALIAQSREASALLNGGSLRAPADSEGGAIEIEGDRFAIIDAASDGELEETLSRLQSAAVRWAKAGEQLRNHAQWMQALETSVASAVRPDLDADAARLMALQVRQELSGAGLAMANTAPAAILALFRD
jgi:flagellin